MKGTPAAGARGDQRHDRRHAQSGIAAIIDHIRTCPAAQRWRSNIPRRPKCPFTAMKVRLKREIVTMGQPDIDPLNDVGHCRAAGLERADFRIPTRS